MNVRSLFFPACYLAATLACLGATGCSVGQSRDAQTYAEYQAAAAAGDWISARKALLRLLEEEDDVAEYWIALGTVQLELGAHADAFYAFSRANELDRGNRQTLAVLTQLALGGGALEMAEQHAKSLSLVAPDDPAVTLTYGYVALRRQDLDKADQMAERLLASYPLESSAKLLKARVLLARGKPDEATQLLDEQLKLKPDDIMSLKSIVALRKRNGEWSKVSAAAMRIAQILPADIEYALLAIEAAFRAKEFDRGARMSERFLQPNSSPEQLGEVLQIWADRWKSPVAIDRIRTFSRRAAPTQALAYATFFNDSGAPGEIAAILGETPKLPINAANASANALIAVAMAARGQVRPAKKILDAILQLEPDHVYALRGRVNLMINAGMAKAAINDAQRLVTIARTSARDRLLLARVYAAAGDRRQVDRTLWNAFHDIPANHDLHEALRSHVQRTAGTEAAASVDREFQQQQETQFSREFY